MTQPTDGASAPLPRSFGRFQLLQPLGKGGMGDIYLAKHGGLAGIERFCVIKVLAKTRGRPQDYVARFMDEARVVVHLNHQGICSVFDVGEVEGDLFIAMEYVAGYDLATVSARLRELGELPPPALVLFILGQVLTALDYAHRLRHPSSGEQLGIVHRDVSPQNVLISFEGEVKLIDFGLAVSTLKQLHTEEGFVLGKLGYMAPEQARGDAVGPSADLFAVGVLAYELLTGERFYAGIPRAELVTLVGQGGYLPPRWDQIEPELAELIRPSLHLAPESRYAISAVFRLALEDYQQKRQLLASADELRELLQRLFPAAKQEQRAMLARYASETDSQASFQAQPTVQEPVPDPARFAEAAASASSGPTPISGSDDEAITALNELSDTHLDALFGGAEAAEPTVRKSEGAVPEPVAGLDPAPPATLAPEPLPEYLDSGPPTLPLATELPPELVDSGPPTLPLSPEQSPELPAPELPALRVPPSLPELVSPARPAVVDIQPPPPAEVTQVVRNAPPVFSGETTDESPSHLRQQRQRRRQLVLGLAVFGAAVTALSLVAIILFRGDPGEDSVPPRADAAGARLVEVIGDAGGGAGPSADQLDATVAAEDAAVVVALAPIVIDAGGSLEDLDGSAAADATVAADGSAAADATVAADVSVDPVGIAADQSDEPEPTRKRAKRRRGRSRRRIAAAAEPKTTPEKIAFLKTCKRRRACARRVLKMSKRLNKIEYKEFTHFMKELDRCVKRCRR